MINVVEFEWRVPKNDMTAGLEATAMSERLKRELETYEAKKQELAAKSEGKFVLIQGESVIGVWDTYADAMQEGYSRFKLDTPFLVKQVSAFERIQFFTRNITPCRS